MTWLADPPPPIATLTLANATNPGTGGEVPTTTDPTLSSQLSGSGSLNGITVQFDTNGDGTVDGSVVTASNGSGVEGAFSYSPQNLAEGQVIIGARAVVPGADGDRRRPG